VAIRIDAQTGVRLAVKSQMKKTGQPGLEESMASLGLDSLDVVELTMALEEDFGIYIPDNQVDKGMTIEDLSELVESKT